MGRHDVNYNKLDKDELMSLELEDEFLGKKFQKIGKKRRFDDGTTATKSGRKKEKVQRGGKEDILEISEEE